MVPWPKAEGKDGGGSLLAPGVGWLQAWDQGRGSFPRQICITSESKIPA